MEVEVVDDTDDGILVKLLFLDYIELEKARSWRYFDERTVITRARTVVHRLTKEYMASLTGMLKARMGGTMKPQRVVLLR